MSLSKTPYQNSDGSWRIPQDECPPPGNTLSVSDVERLAKAGVAIKFEEIKYQIQPDVATAAPLTYDDRPRSLEDSFWDRWKRAHLPSTVHGYMTLPYTINASQHGGKVYVFVSPGDQPPFILEDDAVIYPSDALMAKLALYEKSK